MRRKGIDWLAPIAWALGAFGLVAGLTNTARESEARAQDGTPDATVQEAATPTTPQLEPLDESNSAHFLVTLNTNAMVLARMATMRARRPAVRQLASAIIRDHGSAQARVTAWTEASDVAPLGSPFSSEIAGTANAIRMRLDTTDDADFDRAYAESQIALHVQALRILDERVIPGARNVSFRAMVTHIRRDEARHLEMARRL